MPRLKLLFRSHLFSSHIGCYANVLPRCDHRLIDTCGHVISDMWLWLPAGGVAIECRFNLARVVIGAFQIQNIIAYIQLVCE